MSSLSFKHFLLHSDFIFAGKCTQISRKCSIFKIPSTFAIVCENLNLFITRLKLNLKNVIMYLKNC